MSTKLFEDIIFGPVRSRRLGISLGVNLLPTYGKICSFDCIYCECGYNSERRGDKALHTRTQVREALQQRLSAMKEAGEELNVITFAGNGEPTLNPEFEEIISDTIELRNHYYPEVKISVLSNGTRVTDDSVFRALNRVDNNILKLDSAIERTFKIINAPNNTTLSVRQHIEGLKRFNGNFILQTMFLRGTHNGEEIDNTTPEELSVWIEAVKEVNPKMIMIYTIDRDTPEKNLQKISPEEMNKIANRLETLGYKVSVSC
ncbi:MAG: radical SAM protein [Bacteroidales bacterium]|nr:radical SAM protein [Bacteroidales bacterium]